MNTWVVENGDGVRLAVVLAEREDLVWAWATGAGLHAHLATGDAILIEGNTWGDRFWGVCEGFGQNHLGHVLMRVRVQLGA